MFENRTYRDLITGAELVSFGVTVAETDLHIHADKDLGDLAKNLVIRYRGLLEDYIRRNPDFATTLAPWKVSGQEHSFIHDMSDSAEQAGVGPMASVAGAMSEYVGKDLLKYSDEVIVENGGDIFLKINSPLTMGIYAGDSPLSMKIGLRFDPTGKPFSVCTSSGTIGHSLSLGKSDAVCVVSSSASLADATATAAGNYVKTNDNIEEAIDFCKSICGIEGAVIIAGDKMGAWGNIELTRL